MPEALPQRGAEASAADIHAAIGFREFVALMAAIMALVALGIDSMLPALPHIAQDLQVTVENRQQYVIGVFIAGFSLGQLLVGILSDWLGRKKLMMAAMAVHALVALAASATHNFETLLLWRLLQGAAAAGSRVLVTSVVRDLYVGRTMARVMSLAGMLFLIMPIVAPFMGQFVLKFASWRMIFVVIALACLAVLLWVTARLPETLPAPARTPLQLNRLLSNMRLVLQDRMSVGYTLALGLLSGGMIGFLSSVQQIFQHSFQRPDLLPPVFAAMAATMGIGSLTNAQIVEKVGMRKISHTALIGVIVLASLHGALGYFNVGGLLRFAVLHALMMVCIVMVGGNFNAMAMENMGKAAGAASSLQGFASTLLSALIGMLIGQAFDGTIVPFYTGTALCALLSLLVVYITERGKLFAPHETAIKK